MRNGLGSVGLLDDLGQLIIHGVVARMHQTKTRTRSPALPAPADARASHQKVAGGPSCTQIWPSHITSHHAAATNMSNDEKNQAQQAAAVDDDDEPDEW